MSEIQVHDLRLTFLWAETLPDLVGEESAPPGSPMPFLWSREGYQDRFAAILAGYPDDLGLQAPWPRPAGNFFWTYYLEKKVPGEIPGETAWRFLVPFRGKAPARVSAAPVPDSRFFVEPFFYPHGVGLILSTRLVGSWTLSEVVDIARKLRSDKELKVDWDDGSQEVLNADAFGRKGLKALGRRVFGDGWTGSAAQPEAFSIATLVRAEGADSEGPFPYGGEVHRALQGLTTWSSIWRDDTPLSLAEKRQPVRRSRPASHCLYLGSRGRAVWAPALFQAQEKRHLSCYHRNLTFLSLQVESLAGLVALTAENLQHLQAGTKQESCARRAVGILARLYGEKGEKTYQSRSPRAQIDQGGSLEAINAVRLHFHQEPLK